MDDKQTRVGLLAGVATMLLYGFSLAFTKNITGTIDPFALLGWRFVVAFAAMVVLMALRVIRVKIRRATLGPLLLLALFQPVVYYAAETFGIMRTTASESGLIIAAAPVVMILAAVVIIGRKPSRWQVVGIAVTLAGVIATIAASGLIARFDAVGYTVLLAAIVSYALYTAFAERFARTTSDIDKTFVMVGSGALVFGTIAVAQHAAQGTLDVLVRLPVDRGDFAIAVAYLALGPTVGAFFLQNVAITRIGSTRFSTFVGISTVAALAAGALGLGERLSLPQLLGGAVILAGVYVANLKKTHGDGSFV